MRLLMSTMVTLLLTAFSSGYAQGVYVVQAGDTLNAIAETFGLSAQDIAVANALDNINLLEVGQELVIPQLSDWSAPLNAPFRSLSLNPQIATQGQVQVLQMGLEPGATLTSAHYLGQEVRALQQTDSGYDLLLLTPVLATPGTGILHLNVQGNEAARLSLPVEIVEGDYRREEIRLSAETSRLLDPAIVNREHVLITRACSDFETTKRWQGVFQMPVETPEYTSQFGTLRSYNGGPYRSYHRGLDFDGVTGTPIYAAAPGVVQIAESLQLYGNMVVLSHGLGVCSAYMHLSELTVTPGQEVAAGELIGLMGATGLVTGPHLHFEVRVGGEPSSPLQWISQGVELSLP